VPAHVSGPFQPLILALTLDKEVEEYIDMQEAQGGLSKLVSACYKWLLPFKQ